MHINSSHIAKQLNAVIKKNGWRQKQIQTATGIHQSQISRIRRGLFYRLAPNVRKLCKYANIPLPEASRPKSDHAELVAIIDAIVKESPRRERLLRKLLTAGAALIDQGNISMERQPGAGTGHRVRKRRR